ncbi:MAG: thioredoxin-disulfide reductase [Patescibacteria group bacterium]|nr:thioredoxin-disulfide reductase [Patescibacteria group bacterium]MDD5715510.1 thioredoxin-disulfide reductase [Patescibacteria group bacterium]
MATRNRVAIIGAGPAGLTAAIYLGRAEYPPVVFEGPQPGGQLMETTEISNFPGFPEDIPAAELMSRMRAQAERFGARFIAESVTSVDFSKKPFTVSTGAQSIEFDCVIIATGAIAKWLGLPSEKRLRGKGVSACATCDGFFFKGKHVAVVGGGDSAMEEATFLAKIAASVTILVRGDESSMKASAAMAQRAKQNAKIRFLFNIEIVDILGEQSVQGVRIRDRISASEQTLDVQGVFVAIGRTPATSFLGDSVELVNGYVKATDNTKTSVRGIFTAGDVQDSRYQQAVSAAGLGCMAAIDAEHFLKETIE